MARHSSGPGQIVNPILLEFFAIFGRWNSSLQPKLNIFFKIPQFTCGNREVLVLGFGLLHRRPIEYHGARTLRYFGCLDEVLHSRDILARGTSAHRQVAVYERARKDGATREEALAAVVDWLIAETVRGL